MATGKKTIEIRELETKDIPQLESLIAPMWLMHANSEPKILDVEAFKKFKVSEYFADALKHKNQRVLIAKTSEKVVGCLRLEIEKAGKEYSYTGDILYLDDLVVAPRYRNRGIATMLIEKAKEFAAEKNIKLLNAKIWNFNAPSTKLFKKNKFKPKYTYYFLEL